VTAHAVIWRGAQRAFSPARSTNAFCRSERNPAHLRSRGSTGPFVKPHRGEGYVLSPVALIDVALVAQDAAEALPHRVSSSHLCAISTVHRLDDGFATRWTKWCVDKPTRGVRTSSRYRPGVARSGGAASRHGNAALLGEPFASMPWTASSSERKPMGIGGRGIGAA